MDVIYNYTHALSIQRLHSRPVDCVCAQYRHFVPPFVEDQRDFVWFFDLRLIKAMQQRRTHYCLMPSVFLSAVFSSRCSPLIFAGWKKILQQATCKSRSFGVDNGRTVLCASLYISSFHTLWGHWLICGNYMENRWIVLLYQFNFQRV